MLLGSFFNIAEKNISGTTVSAAITINAKHKIFQGHFPGHPVVPGVCMMQMVKEILETILEKKLQLRKAHNLKFLAIIDPVKDPNVQVEFSYSDDIEDEITVTGKLYKETVSFLKFKGAFVPYR